MWLINIVQGNFCSNMIKIFFPIDSFLLKHLNPYIHSLHEIHFHFIFFHSILKYWREYFKYDKLYYEQLSFHTNFKYIHAKSYTPFFFANQCEQCRLNSSGDHEKYSIISNLKHEHHVFIFISLQNRIFIQISQQLTWKIIFFLQNSFNEVILHQILIIDQTFRSQYQRHQEDNINC